MGLKIRYYDSRRSTHHTQEIIHPTTPLPFRVQNFWQTETDHILPSSSHPPADSNTTVQQGNPLPAQVIATAHLLRKRGDQ